ncbi:hypothetical protein TCAL_02289 [Tigriopus californicus]|uniref:Ig-like domain-containing protein n=1 Tax=Tigriopus californicus TaxID=6832 RepID=A0A553NP33_TIGCA|nr:lachesin-like [Tigriopus californicus]TRY67184.1 hypothetical protein TCAL_02289 [Tigriopus californicus]
MYQSCVFILCSLVLLEPARLYGAEGIRSRHQHHYQNSLHRSGPQTMELINDPEKEPMFASDLPRNLTVQLGGTAYLPCTVHNLGNKSVSWIRNRDTHILTSDRDVFIVDERFSSLYNPDSSTWTLQIKYVQPRDAGSYECQVSTSPKKMHFFNLAVVVPKVRIIGNKDIHVQAGSEVQLKCVVSQAVEHPSFIVWYHNDKMVVSSGRRFPRYETPTRDSSIGTFTISHVVKSDAGNYTCQPANLHSAKVSLHVVNGELSEPSIQGSGGALSLLIHSELLFCCS